MTAQLLYRTIFRAWRKSLPMAGFYVGTLHGARMASFRGQTHNAAKILREKGYLITSQGHPFLRADDVLSSVEGRR